MKYHFNLILTLILCCSQAFSASAPRAMNRPDIVLVTMDTLRADHLGCYGYTEIKTPALDALAGDGLLYQNAFAQVPLTWPSHTAIMTGTYPFHNGVQDFTGQPLAPYSAHWRRRWHRTATLPALWSVPLFSTGVGAWPAAFSF